MNKFTEAYAEARRVFADQKFADDWDKFLREKCQLESMLGVDGPSHEHHSGLDKLLNALAGKEKAVGAGKGDKGVLAVTNIMAAAENADVAKFRAAAATLKLLKHLHYAKKRGSQVLWIYAPPTAYTDWIYDELNGTKDEVKTKLAEDEEAFTKAQQKFMKDALPVAAHWVSKVIIALGSKKKSKIRQQVKDWFAGSGADDEKVDGLIADLLAGFKKIQAIINTNTLIFAYDPNDRKGGKWTSLVASVFKDEKIHAVYIAGVWLQRAKDGQQWACARTIIHELSHRAVKTADHRYAPSGIKPGRDGSFGPDQAIDNADSWAYFAVDVVGVLPDSYRTAAQS